MERKYSVEDMCRYIMFARQFKPKVSLQLCVKLFCSFDKVTLS